MKTLKLFSIFLSLVLISLAAMSFISTDSVNLNSSGSYALLPDLKVSQIATPGGLCKGNLSKVRVNVTNSQMIGVKEKIAVILYVSQQGSQPSSYVGYLEKGIGPNDNSGQPVWFNNVIIQETGQTVTLKAVVNPDQEIQESVYNNNTKIIQARVSKVCGQTTSTAQGATLTVTAYTGMWNSGNYTAVPGASVTLVKSGQTFTGTTGSNGKATFPNLPTGMCDITVTKQGYQNGTKAFMMSSYPNNTNIAMVPL